jgi:hypothetical protein
MKIYNYSDKPIQINGVPRDEHILFLNASIPEWNVKHNNHVFLPTRDEDRNIVTTIYKLPSGSYSYRHDNFSTPDVWLWVSIFLTFFSFHFILRIIQKIKMS